MKYDHLWLSTDIQMMAPILNSCLYNLFSKKPVLMDKIRSSLTCALRDITHVQSHNLNMIL